MDRIEEGFVKCIYKNEWALYKEDNRFHISTACLASNDITLRSDIVKFFIEKIKKVQPASIICVSKGVDQAIFTLTTWIASELLKPMYVYNLNEPISPEPIRSNLSNCTLFLPYVSDEISFLEDLNFIRNLGGNIVQVIVIVNESEILRKICNEHKIDLFEFTDLSKIINELKNIGSSRSQEIILQLKC
jgi:hypothetical protein